MEFIEKMKWRYATKQFDKDRKISKEDLNKLKEAVMLSASSFGLQLYKVIIPTEEKRRELRKASFDQPQITDASHLMVFAFRTNISTADVDEFVNLVARTRNQDKSALAGFGEMMNNFVSSRNDLDEWAARQTYLALGTLLAAAADMKIDSCPMEGFDPGEYDKILGLKDKNLRTTVIAALGYRSPTDQYQHLPKVRRPKEELFEEV